MLINKSRLPIKKILLIGFLPNFLKLIYYRANGATIGRNVKFGFGSVINCKDIIIGSNVEFGHFTLIKSRKFSVGNFSKIGSVTILDVPCIEIGEDVVIRENVLIGGNETPNSKFIIGDRSHIRQSCVINTSDLVKIGNESAIGGGTNIFTHSSWQSILEGYPCSYRPVVIGNNVWVGWNVFIMPGIVLNDGVLVTAGSIITRDAPEKSLVSGNPAKVVIPSNMFPRAILKEEKNEIIIKLLKDFCEYLIFNSIKASLIQTDSLIEIDVKNKKRTFRIYLLLDNSEIKSLVLSKEDALILLEDMSEKDYNRIFKNSCMILNLSTYTRVNSNEVGEELADYLLKFGIKFKRVNRF